MISVNLSGQNDLHVSITVCESQKDYGAFFSVQIGPLSIIMPDAKTARALAAQLHYGADRIEGMPPFAATVPQVPGIEDEIHF